MNAENLCKYHFQVVQTARFKAGRDRFFPFNSTAKRSSVVLHRDDGRVRLYTKGEIFFSFAWYSYILKFTYPCRRV
jgi:magnesium-transporting ATPase (P-type)